MVGLTAGETAETGGREVGAQVTGEGTLKAFFNLSHEAQQHKPIISIQVTAIILTFIYSSKSAMLTCLDTFTS